MSLNAPDLESIAALINALSDHENADGRVVIGGPVTLFHPEDMDNPLGRLVIQDGFWRLEQAGGDE